MNNTLITQDRLDELVRLCSETPKGLVMELGVYKGGSLKFLAQAFPDRAIWGFDTFTGLPVNDWNQHEHHTPGEFKCSVEEVKAFLSDCPNVTLIEGYFPESIPVQLNDAGQCISFVHVDTDFGASIWNAFVYLYPMLKPGGIMVFDDYNWQDTPHVKSMLEQIEKTFGVKHFETRAKHQAYIFKAL